MPLEAERWLASLAMAGVLLAFAPGSRGAEVVEHSDHLSIRGLLDANDLEKVDFSGKNAVVFEHSLGGTYAAALRYVDAIRKHGLNTVVKGKCFSACAIAFLAGKTRRADTSDGTISVVSFHSGRMMFNGVARPSQLNGELVDKIRELSGDRMSAVVLKLIGDSWTEASGVLFVEYPSVLFARRKTLYCDGSQGVDTSKCKSLPDADPFKLGVFTQD